MAEKYIVEGYEFDTIEEANEAKKELEAVKFMSEKTNGCTPEVAYKIYNKIVEGNLFKTAIGYDYIRALEEFLIMNGKFDVVSDDEDYVQAQSEIEEQDETFAEDNNTTKEQKVDPNSIEFLKSNVPEKKDKEDLSPEALQKKLNVMKGKLNTSVFLNIVLGIAIVVMLYIASTSSNVNIINYETALQDKYSSWAEELKEKENQLNEREKAIEKLENK